MSELLVVGYNDESTAERVLDTLQRLEREDFRFDLDDAAVLVRNQKGKVKVTTTDDMVKTGTISGMFWGVLAGALFLTPIGGLALGGLIGAGAGNLKRLGLKDDFKDQLADLVQPGTSAIMAIVRHSSPEQIIEEFKPYGGEVIRTSLTDKAEEELMDALHGQQKKGAA